MDLSRLELLIGTEKIEKLKEKTIFILGLGGVGGYAFESLVRSGFEHFVLADFDTFSSSNLNRQLACTKDTIGQKKVDVYQKRAKTINPQVTIETITEKVTISTLRQILSKKIDFVLDACDDLKIKEELIRLKSEKHFSMISSMGTGNKRYPEKLEICELQKTSYDPIAKRLRKMMKDEKIKEKVMVVYSKEEKIKKQIHTIPSACFVPATAGILCASYIFNSVVGDLNE